MDDLPKNLQRVVVHVAETPEKYSNNIKERLNLHVKRRLQQEAVAAPCNISFASSATLSSKLTDTPTVVSNNEGRLLGINAALTINSTKLERKSAPKTRRPYQKRVHKITSNKNGSKTVIPSIPSVEIVQIDEVSASEPPSRKIAMMSAKRRQKTKSHLQQNAVSNPSNLSEDDGSYDGTHELECRATSVRDRDKCPDALSMVLSLKRHGLLQDPEVQEFLRNIITVIKS